MDPVPRASEMTLEVFPSLRSPYTAIGFERAVELARRAGVQRVVRPVLPMVMRGVPVPFAKGKYIMLDTHREAEKMGMPFGRVLDPIGEPVRRAYSLWPWARDRGRGEAFLAAFLRAAFSEGIDTSSDTGLRRVVERSGLPWEEAAKRLDDPAWEEELEINRLVMIE
jgi:2-hydroxychromene-2-carboxylate isomerase